MSTTSRIVVTIIGGILGILILFYLFFGVASFDDDFKRSGEEQTSTITSQEAIFSEKTAYVGDNSKVSHILDQQAYPEALVVKHFEILSQAEPYGLHVYLSKTPKDAKQALSDNALLTFYLIDNLSKLSYVEDKSEKVIASYERKEMKASLEVLRKAHSRIEETRDQEG